jgi:hypothetical protein
MENKNISSGLPWHASCVIVLTVFVFLYLQHDMARPGWWAEYWWPLVRMIGGFWLVLLFIDGIAGGPSRRSRKRFMNQ